MLVAPQYEDGHGGLACQVDRASAAPVADVCILADYVGLAPMNRRSDGKVEKAEDDPFGTFDHASQRIAECATILVG
jgi:hypothetical protein